jgi:hypothetical protein
VTQQEKKQREPVPTNVSELKAWANQALALASECVSVTEKLEAMKVSQIEIAHATMRERAIQGLKSGLSAIITATVDHIGVAAPTIPAKSAKKK